jgi:hypothetical protein
MSWRRFRGVVAGLPIVIAGIASAALPARAADEPPPEAPPPAFVAPPPGYEPGQPGSGGPTNPEALPAFFTLDRMDGNTRFGIQVGLNKVDQISLSDGFFTRFEPYGQYVHPGKLFGIYGHIPLAHAFITGADASGTGNLSLGGFLMPMYNSNLILRGGLAFDTASDTLPDVLANAYTVYERLTDLLLVAPNYTTARVSASTVQQSGEFFFRADGGFDLAIDKPAGANTSVFFRANAAGGMRVQEVNLTLELVNIAAVNGSGFSGVADRFNHTLAFSVRTPGDNQIHVGMVFPLDDDARGEFWILSLGYQRAM